MDLISVIVPVYNVEKYLRECVDSILRQVYTNLEIILVDDGSTDSSGTMCDEYAKKDDRIRVIHKQNGGLSDARNAGLDICSGEYISFVDSDDIISDYFIEYLHDTMVRENSDIVALRQTARFWDDGIQKPNFDDSPDYQTDNLSSFDALIQMYYQVIPTGIQHKFYKRFLFDDLRFPKGYLYEDLATSYKLFMKCSTISLISPAIYGYRKRSGSIIRSDFKKEKMVVIEISQELFDKSLKFDPRLEHAAACRVFSAISSVYLQAPMSDKETIDKLWIEMKKYKKFVDKENNALMRKKIRFCSMLMNFGKSITHTIGRKYGQKGSFYQ